MDILYLFKLLWRRKWILIAVPLIAFDVAFLFTSEAEDQYLSKAQLATGFTIKNQQVKLIEDGFNLREADIMFNNAIETINSPLIISMLSYNLILHDLGANNAFRVPVNREGEQISLSKEVKQEATRIFSNKMDSLQTLTTFNGKERQLIELLKRYRYDYESLKSSLKVYRVNYTDYIGIEFTSSNPELSAFTVNTLCREFLRFNTFQQVEQKGQSVQFFENLVLQKKNELDEKADELKHFKTSNNVINYQFESEAKVTQITNLEDQKVEAENRIRELQVSLKNIESQINRTDSYQNNAGNTNNRVINLRNRLNDMNARYINSGANNTLLLDSIEGIRRELNKEIAQAAGGTVSRSKLYQEKNQLEVDLEIATNSLNAINGRLRNVQSNVSSYASNDASITRLEQQVAVASAEYLDAQEKLNTSKNLALASDNSMKQVLYGQPAVEPEPSKTLITAGLTGMTSLVLCIFVILFLEYIDVTIKTPATFRKVTGLELAGTLNYINLKQFNLDTIFQGSRQTKELITFEHLIRKLRHEIESASAKVILITSTKKDEGKSFIILCIAYSLSLIGKRVLIIDTNFKHNTLTKTLLIENDSHKIAGKNKKIIPKNTLMNTQLMNADGDRHLNYSSNIISTSNYKNIDVIGSKYDNNSPSEIFSGRNFQGLLNETKKHYDYVLMEGANLNAFSDTRELVQYADLILPIFSAKSVLKQLDKESITYLKSLNGKLTGAILNMVDEKNLHLQ